MLDNGFQLSKYRLIRLLGKGGMGEVYEAQDSLRHVAIKVLPVASDHQALRLFHRELRIVASFNHACIVPLYDFGEQDEYLFLVMPLFAGSLATWRQQQQKRLTPKEVAALVKQAAQALHYAHDQGVLHLDVKPANFLLRPTTGTAVPDLLLTDFGIAKLTAAASMSVTVRGTPTYMAPEQWKGHPCCATDQYALAVMAYDLLTGRPPFQGSMEQLLYQHTEVAPPRPSGNDPQRARCFEVILRGLAKQPTYRYASIDLFAHALEKAAQASGASRVKTPLPRMHASSWQDWRGYSSPEKRFPCQCYGGVEGERCPGPCPGWGRRSSGDETVRVGS